MMEVAVRVQLIEKLEAKSDNIKKEWNKDNT